MFQDLDESIPDDDELHSPHFGDTDSEEAVYPEEFDWDSYEGEESD